MNFKSRHYNILESFEDRFVDFRNDEENKIDPSAEPINILCIDGGGMKGSVFVIFIVFLNFT